MKKIEKKLSTLLKSLAKANKSGKEELEVKLVDYRDINFFIRTGYTVKPVQSKKDWYKVSTTSVYSDNQVKKFLFHKKNFNIASAVTI